MKNFTIPFLSFALLYLFSNPLLAQDYEIRAIHQGGGLIAVEGRYVGAGVEPAQGSDAFLDLTIDLRWPEAANLNMGNPNNTGGYGISKAGNETVDGTDEYQGYQLASAPAFLPVTWTKDMWIEIFTVQSNSAGNTGETIVVGALGSNPFNPNIPNFNMSGFDFTPIISGAAVLPVELSGFEVQKIKETSARISWSTASEQGTAHFNLERSTDARNWSHLEKVTAAGNSFEHLDYSYFDKDLPLHLRQTGTVYYRLKIMDFNGTFEYSPVKSIHFERTESKVMLYPNPTQDIVHIESEEEVNMVTLYNSQGQIITTTISNQLDLKNYPSGVYRIGVETERGMSFKSVVKMED